MKYFRSSVLESNYFDKSNIKLSSGLNSIIGESASGKTALLNLITSKLKGENVVKDKNIHINVIKEIIDFAKNLGFYIRGITYSPVKGPNGNIEYLLYLSKNDLYKDILYDIEDVVNASHKEL